MFAIAARSGTVACFRTDFLDDDNTCESEIKDIVAIMLAPNMLKEVKKGPGERKRMQEAVKQCEGNHKNFYIHGVKFIACNKEEFRFLKQFRELRKKMNRQHKFLFADFDEKEDASHVDQRDKTRKFLYWRQLLNDV